MSLGPSVRVSHSSTGRVEQINQVLRALQSASADIEACALISDDGLMIASSLPNHLEEARVAGISATVLSFGTRACQELERGEIREVLVRGDSGYALMITVGSGTLLLCLTNGVAKLGLVLLDMRRSVEEIRRIL